MPEGVSDAGGGVMPESEQHDYWAALAQWASEVQLPEAAQTLSEQLRIALGWIERIQGGNPRVGYIDIRNGEDGFDITALKVALLALEREVLDA